jgi:hypothetical protein
MAAVLRLSLAHRHSGAMRSIEPGISRFRVRYAPRNDNPKQKVSPPMPVILDPDAAAIYQAFQDAGRPAYETLTAP